MPVRILPFLLIFLFGTQISFSQPEDCVGALPVCGNGDLNITPNGRGIDDFAGGQNPTCFPSRPAENESVWLKFSIKTSGTLGFTLSPQNSQADYDFAVYGPNVDCNNLGTSLRCSTTNPQQAGVSALTGMNATETDVSEGPGANGNGFVKWINVNAGERYLLFIDKFNQTQGFNLSWTGTALLNDIITKAEGGVDLGPDINICENENLTLDATWPQSQSYLWNTGATTPQIMPTTPGQYHVKVTSNSGCISRDTVNVTFKPVPLIATATSNINNICEPANITFSATGDSGTYEWFYPDGSAAGTGPIITIPAVVANDSGQFTVRLTNSVNCSDEAKVDITVFPLPNIQIAGATQICENDDLSLTASGGNQYSWEDPGGNVISNDARLLVSNVSPANNGTYRVTVTTSNGCIDSATVDVDVEPAIQMTAASNSPQCDDGQLDFVATGSPTLTYTWFNPQNTVIGNGQNLTITDLDDSMSGTYKVRAESARGCYKEENLDVTVNPTYLFPDSTLICPGQQFVVPQTGQVVTQTDFITVNLLTANGCDSIYTYDVTRLECVDDRCTGYPTAFTPNGNSENDAFKPLFSPFCIPNEFSMSVYNRWGEKVFTTTTLTNGWDGRMPDGSHALPGLYLWYIELELEDVSTGQSSRIIREGGVTLIR